MNIYLALFSLWHTLLFAPSPQMMQGIIHGNTASGSPVAPTFVSADSNQYNEVGTLFTFDAITTSSGNLLWVVGGMRGSGDCAQLTIASFIGGSASGDSWTKIPATSPSDTFDCAISWLSTNVHAGSGNYVIKVTSLTGSSSTMLASIGQFTMGSLAGTVDTTCVNTATSGTSLTCSSAMSPGATLELGLSGILAYDSSTCTQGGGFTIPTGGTSASTVGSVALQYKIANPTSGTYTPSFSTIGAGDGGAMIGVLIK